MIDLALDNDPLLFRVEIPSGALVVQWNEALAALSGKQDAAPQVADVAAALRKVARTPEVAAGASDEILFAVFARMGKAVEQAGN
jgi:hypothetical protein